MGLFGKKKSRAQELYDEAVKDQKKPLSKKDKERLKKEREKVLRPNRIIDLPGTDETHQRLMIAKKDKKKDKNKTRKMYTA